MLPSSLSLSLTLDSQDREAAPDFDLVLFGRVNLSELEQLNIVFNHVVERM